MPSGNNPGHWVYNTAQWRALRLSQLAAEPLCRYCSAIGIIEPATVANHKRPHRGDPVLAFDPENLESVCESCHNRHSDAHDKGLPISGCDADGYPLDPLHKWSED